MSTLGLSKGLVLPKKIIIAASIISMVVCLTIGAHVRIPLPFTPVPITLQTFFVILGAALLGGKNGSIAVLSYILMGVIGIPVFQGYNYGIMHLLGPTGGYLAGFLAAALIAGFLSRKLNKGILNSFIIMLTAVIAVYSLGIMWLVIGLKFSLYQAILLGVVPFIPGEAIKVALASLIYSKVGAKAV